MRPTSSIKYHPKNPNKHTKEQIRRLAELLIYQGFRHPIIVSGLSGICIAGHGRLEAAKFLELDEVPVDIQNFIDSDQEYAFLVSDNGIAAWADLDLSMINTDIGDLGPDFDVTLLGLNDFLLEPADKFIDKKLEQELWSETFEGPQKVFKIVISVEQENYRQKILDLLNIKNVKNFGNLMSVRWPEILNE